ncbi:MAG: tetratricopeptide repeat protein, partial [Acidobacteriota bacterium]
LFSEEKKGLLYFCRGLTFKETKDWNGAEKKFKNALKLNYDPKTTRLQLIEVYINKQDIESASTQLAELKKTNEKNETMIFIAGYINYRKGNFQEALTAFEILATSSLSAKTNLALLYYNNGDYAKSVEKWEEILSEEPDNKMAQINMGRALFHLGDTSKAQEYFSKAGITPSPGKFSPKKIPLSYENMLEEIKFDLMCKAE